MPNAWGLYDMHGNYREWCRDPYFADYYGGSPSDDPIASGIRDSRFQRVLRGGSFSDEARVTRSAHREHDMERVGHTDMGVRLAMTIEAAKLKPATPSVPDADRRAAEYIVSVGGRLLTDHSDQWTDVVPEGAFQLKGVNLERKAVTDEGLAAFQGCSELETLNLGWTGITDAGVVHFKDCKKLTSLMLGSLVTDEGLANFQGCDRLESLTLICSTQKITDAGLALFKNCQELNFVYLHHANVGDAGLAQLKNYKKLAQLHLDRSSITGAGLALLKDWPELHEFGLVFTTVGDEGMAHLKECQQLRSLHFVATNISDVGLAHLKECKGLTSILIARTPAVTAGMVEELRAALPNCNITWKPVSSADPGPSDQATITPEDGWIDLMPAVDVTQHGPGWTWRIEDGELVGIYGLGLPVIPVGSYEWEIEFTPALGSGPLLNFTFPHEYGRAYVAVIDKPGIHDWHPAGAKKMTRVIKAAPAVSRGEKHVLKIALVTQDDTMSLATTIDGQPWAEWSGETKSLASDSLGSRCPGVWSSSQLTIHASRLRMLSGEASWHDELFPKGLEELATGIWIPLLASREDLEATAGTEVKWADGVLELLTPDGFGAAQVPSAPRGRSMILRAEVKRLEGPAMLLLDRSDGRRSVQFHSVQLQSNENAYVLFNSFSRDSGANEYRRTSEASGFEDLVIAIVVTNVAAITNMYKQMVCSARGHIDPNIPGRIYGLMIYGQAQQNRIKLQIPGAPGC